MKKKAALFIVTAALTMLVSMPSFAASWQSDANGWWYVTDGGYYLKNQIATIDGVDYMFGPDGYMVTGWGQSAGKWYYFNPEAGGAKATGWIQDGGKWYYLDPQSGEMKSSSFLKKGGNIYYLDGSGAMATGTFVVDGYYYFAEPDGRLRRNTREEENGIIIRYDSEGREWYQNATTNADKEAGGTAWQRVAEGKRLEDDFADAKRRVDDYVEEVEYEFYDDYKELYATSKSTTQRRERIDSWEKKVNKKLTELNVSQDEIKEYIGLVEEGCWDGDEGYWVYSEENFTYTFYGPKYYENWY